MEMNLRRDGEEICDFLGGFVDWLGTDDAEVSMAAIDAIAVSFEGADVDLDERRIVWKDGNRLTIDESAERIHKETGVDLEAIKIHIVCWLEMSFVPKDFDEVQMAAFESRISEWIESYEGEQKSAGLNLK
jgi:hypothetical protein